MDDRRAEMRWPTAALVRITFANGAVAESRVLNINLGGCFLEGEFGLNGGEILAIESGYHPLLNGLQAQVVWVVREPTLVGIGVRFQPLGDEQQVELVRWFNSLVPAEYRQR